MKLIIFAIGLTLAVALAQEQAQVTSRLQTTQPPIAIVRQSAEMSPEGTYAYNFETANGIAALGMGTSVQGPDGKVSIVSQGQYGYTAPDGTPIVLEYTADENGFHPRGAHLPQPHPIPEYIQRSIEYNIAHAIKQQQQEVVHQ